MNQLVWWCLVAHLGVCGAMATVGCLNWQWWRQDRSERLLGSTAVLCWSLTLALISGAVGLAFPLPEVWRVVLPVRAIFIGIVAAVFLQTLSTMVRLPGIRTAVVTSLALPVIFVGLGLTGLGAYVFAPGSLWPHFEPLGNALAGASTVIFAGFALRALSLLPDDRRRQLALAMLAVAGLLVLSLVSPAGFFKEAMATLWSVPIAILLAVWCSARVLRLQGSLVSAEAGMRQAERTAHYLARHDGLTGLPNRVAAAEALQVRLENADSTEHVVVCQVQVNRLEQIRAAYGLPAGNTVLSAIADFLVATLTEDGSVARVGDTSFLVVRSWNRHHPLCRLEAEVTRGLAELSRSVVLPTELSLVVGVAVGVESVTARELVQQAQIAVTAAEDAGRAVQLFRPDLLDGIVRRARTARLLTAAIDRDEFEVHYQPVIDTSSMVRVGVEALVRWRHHGRLHPPAEWIPIAEEQGLMPDIGLTVLRIAVRDHAVLQCPVAVNVSPQQLADPGFVAAVLQTLGRCPASALTLEVTESCVMADLDEARTRLETLRSHGIRIALDDFGTQYSSLSRLASLPLDIIKIDRSFVTGVLSTEGRAMVIAIHAMAGALGKITVAEGVETPEQLAALIEIGCDRVQGFLTGRPVPLADLVHSRDSLAELDSTMSASRSSS